MSKAESATGVALERLSITWQSDCNYEWDDEYPVTKSAPSRSDYSTTTDWEETYKAHLKGQRPILCAGRFLDFWREHFGRQRKIDLMWRLRYYDLQLRHHMEDVATLKQWASATRKEDYESCRVQLCDRGGSEFEGWHDTCHSGRCIAVKDDELAARGYDDDFRVGDIEYQEDLEKYWRAKWMTYKEARRHRNALSRHLALDYTASDDRRYREWQRGELPVYGCVIEACVGYDSFFGRRHEPFDSSLWGIELSENSSIDTDTYVPQVESDVAHELRADIEKTGVKIPDAQWGEMLRAAQASRKEKY